jgi:predicted DNA-binding protein
VLPLLYDHAMSNRFRISAQTLAQLRYLAKRGGAPIEQVLREAIDEQYRKAFLKDCNLAYARLRSDEAAWKDELAERKAWESTLGDGIQE